MIAFGVKIVRSIALRIRLDFATPQMGGDARAVGGALTTAILPWGGVIA